MLAGFALLALAPAAQAEVTIGSSLAGTPIQAPPGNCVPEGCTAASGQVTATAAGVVTLWRIRSGAQPNPVAFQVLRPAGGADVVEVGRTPTVTPTADAPSEHLTRIPIQVGDRIGIVCCQTGTGDNYVAATPAATVDVWGPPVADTPAAPVGSGDLELLVNADIEPDVDGDEYGDESQDNCPANSNPGQEDTNGDGVGNACDADGDGVPDASDACPTTAGSGPGGCPLPPPATPRVNQPPTVRFRTPLAGTAVGRSQVIELDVSDDAGPVTVSLFDDDGTICTVSAAPYSCTWTPTGADVGRATLLASAVDSEGRSTLGIVRVRVSRFAADLTARRRGRRVSGRLVLPAAVERSLGCRGDVTVRRGKVRRTVALKRNCTYSVRLPRGRGTPRARFAGNAVVLPAS